MPAPVLVSTYSAQFARPYAGAANPNYAGYNAILNVQAGDLLVVLMVQAGSADDGYRVAVTGGGFDWAPLLRLREPTHPAADLWVAVSDVTGNVTIGAGELRWGSRDVVACTMQVWRNARVGAFGAVRGLGQPSMSLFTRGENSKIVYLSSDITPNTAGRSAVQLSTGIATASSGDDSGYEIDATAVSTGGVYSDSGSAGQKDIGLTASGPAQLFTYLAVEIAGTAGLGDAQPVESGDSVAVRAVSDLSFPTVAAKVSPFGASDNVGEVGFRLYRQVNGTLVADGARNTASVAPVPGVPNGYRANLTDAVMTRDADGSYRGLIVWDTGGLEPAHAVDEVFVGPRLRRLYLGQPVPAANAPGSAGDSLNAARAQGFGRWLKAGNLVTLFAADGVTVVRTFVLDHATQPAKRE